MPSWYDDVRSAACLLDSRRDQLPAGHLDYVLSAGRREWLGRPFNRLVYDDAWICWASTTKQVAYALICCHHSIVPYYSIYRSRSIIHWIGYRFWSNNVDDIGHLLCAADWCNGTYTLGIWRIEFIEPTRIQCKELHFPANCCDHVGTAMILITTSTTLPPMIWDEKLRFVYLAIKKKNLNIMVAVNKAILRIGERTHVARSIGNAKWWRRAIFAEQSEMRDLDLKHLGVPAMYIKTSYSLLEQVGEMRINILRRKQG